MDSGNDTLSTIDPTENEIDVGSEDIEDITNMLDLYKLENDKDSTTDNFIIPLRIIIPVNHIHYNDNNTSHELNEYIVLKTDDEDYHEHIVSQPKTILQEYNANVTNKDMDVSLKIGNKTITEIVEKLKSPVFANREHTLIYKILKSYNISETVGFDELETVDFDIEKTVEMKIERDVKSHYELLKKWLSYKF
jgi:hypothetical protein